MSAQGLGSRAIIGEFYKTLEQDTGVAWVNAISMLFNSDQSSETYKWLGQVAAMREWIGGRQAKGFTENGITIANKSFESTIEYLVDELRRDKTGQMLVRIRDLAERANAHWASLLTTLIVNGASTVCYDGQYFFDTDHSEGSSGTQSNDITTDISALPATTHGASASAPSIEEAQQSILASVSQIMGFKDDKGEPMNENAKSFLVMAPMNLYIPMAKALALPAGTGMTEQGLDSSFMVKVVPNVRLTATDTFYTFRADGNIKALIRQEEQALQLKVQAEGSSLEFNEKKHQYGVDAMRNVGYGLWQHAVLNQLV